MSLFSLAASTPTYAANTDTTVGIIRFISIFLTTTLCAAPFAVAAIVAFIVIAIRRRREENNDTFSNAPQKSRFNLIWLVVGVLVLLLLISATSVFVIGFNDYRKMTETPTKATATIKVIAHKWAWQFQYENGYVNDGEIIVPGGENVHVLITSKDVIHSFFVPQFRMKKDAVPGRQNEMWLNALYDPTDPVHAVARTLKDPATQQEIHFKVNVFDVFCAQYCGQNHSHMVGHVVVVDPKEYEAFMKLTNEAHANNHPLAEAQ